MTDKQKKEYRKKYYRRNKIKWKVYSATNRNRYRDKRRAYNRQYKPVYRETHPWAKTWESIESRVNGRNGEEHKKYYYNKGIKNLLTFKDLRYIWFRDDANLMKRPSIHRKDSNKNYTISNCKYVEWSNHYKIHKEV